MNLIKTFLRMKEKETMAQVAERLKAQGIKAFEERNNMDGNGVYWVFLGTNTRGYPGRGDMVFQQFLKENIMQEHREKAYNFGGRLYIPVLIKRDLTPPALPVHPYDESKLRQLFTYRPTQSDREKFDAVCTGMYKHGFAVIMLDPSRYICPGTDRKCMDAENGFWAFSERGLGQLEREMRVRRIETGWKPSKL